MDVTSFFRLFQLGKKFHGLSVIPPAASVSSDEVPCRCLAEGTGDMKTGLVLAVKPNSTACRAGDVFGNIHRDLWPLPAASLLLLLRGCTLLGGESEQEEKKDLPLWCILT